MTRYHIATTSDGRRIFLPEDPATCRGSWADFAFIEDQHSLPGVTDDTSKPVAGSGADH